MKTADSAEIVPMRAWGRFQSNLGSLYAFFERLGLMADAQDKEKIREIASGLASLFGRAPEDVAEELQMLLPTIDDLDIYPDPRNESSVNEVLATLHDSEFLEALAEWQHKHPYKAQKFLRSLYSAFEDPPTTGITLRRGIFVMLMSFLEILVGDLFADHFQRMGETRSQAIEHARAMDADGWGKRFGNLRNIGVSTDPVREYETEIVEFGKRRNLIVHNDGVVDDRYLRNAPQRYRGLSPGDTLIVSTQYLQRAIDVVFCVGFVLCMENWRLGQVPGKKQHQALDRLVISSLNQKRYSLVLLLTETLREITLPEMVQHRMTVDRAVAFRELGKADEVRKLVTQLSGTRHDWQVDIALAMLRGDPTEVRRRMARARDHSQDLSACATWPLFDPVKNEPWFKIALRRGDGKNLRRMRRQKRHRP